MKTTPILCTVKKPKKRNWRIFAMLSADFVIECAIGGTSVNNLER